MYTWAMNDNHCYIVTKANRIEVVFLSDFSDVTKNNFSDVHLIPSLSEPYALLESKGIRRVKGIRRSILEPSSQFLLVSSILNTNM